MRGQSEFGPASRWSWYLHCGDGEGGFRAGMLSRHLMGGQTVNKVSDLVTDSMCIPKKLDTELVVFVPSHD